MRGLAAFTVAAASLVCLASGEAPASATRMVELAKQVPERLGPRFAVDWVAVEAAPAAERRAASAAWIVEALAPLTDPACRSVLETLGRPPRDPASIAAGLAQDLGEAVPVAPPAGGPRLLVAEHLPAQGRADIELLGVAGVLPLEVALSGEWARAVGVRHAGPALAGPLLRQSRAARLEGLARLAGILVVVRGSGLQAADLGAGLVKLDRDRASWPREATLARLDDPLERALLKVHLEDGLRWATYHYLVGGEDGLLAALERPLVSPAELLRPGSRRAEPAGLPAGCSLGPRGIAALLTGRDNGPWADGLVGDRLFVDEEGTPSALLAFDARSSALAGAAALAGKGWTISIEGERLRLHKSAAP